MTKRFRFLDVFIYFNKEYKWLCIEHNWKDIVMKHKLTWGFGHRIRYYRDRLPF